MQIVIDIPEDAHGRIVRPDRIFTDDDINAVVWAVYNGIELPKGHGRLIDADELRTKSIDVNAEFGNEWWCVDCDDIELAPTVLEADKKI